MTLRPRLSSVLAIAATLVIALLPLLTVLDGLALGVEPDERRKKRRVNIEDTIRVSAHENGREDAHETGETDDFDVMGPEPLQHGSVEGFPRIVVFVRKHCRGNAGLSSALESLRVGLVAHDDADPRVEPPARDRVQDRLEIRAAARDQDGQSLIAHEPSTTSSDPSRMSPMRQAL